MMIVFLVAVFGIAAVGGGALLTAKSVLSKDERNAADLPERLPLADTVAGATSREVTSRDGTTLHVIERGTGQPIVLVHGLGADHTVWGLQFAALCDDHRVIAFDTRGCGRSSQGVDGYGPHRNADDLAAVLTELDVRDAIVVGHSLGGTTVGQMCVDHPELLGDRVGGLVFAATFASAVAGEGGFRERFTPTLLKLSARSQRNKTEPVEPSTSAIAYAMARSSFGNPVRPADVRHTQALLARTPRARSTQMALENIEYDIRGDVAHVTVPVLVVSGIKDNLSTARSAAQLCTAFPHARHVQFDDSGHHVMIERHEEFSRLLEELVEATCDTGRAGPPATRESNE